MSKEGFSKIFIIITIIVIIGSVIFVFYFFQQNNENEKPPEEQPASVDISDDLSTSKDGLELPAEENIVELLKKCSQ